MPEENISQEFRLKNIEEMRSYLIEQINQIELMSKKYKKVYRVVNYTEHLPILVSTVTGCISISAFAWYSGRNCEFCNRIKNLCNNCRNLKV